MTNDEIRMTNQAPISNTETARRRAASRSRVAVVLVVAFSLLIAARDAAACQIPVFRYALERWQPESVEIVIFHQGPLTKAQQSTIAALSGDAKTPANTSV